jgi:hypothetical protein
MMSFFLLLALTNTPVQFSWKPSSAIGITHQTLACGKVSGGPYTFATLQLQPTASTTTIDMTTGETFYCVITDTNWWNVTSKPSNQVTVTP